MNPFQISLPYLILLFLNLGHLGGCASTSEHREKGASPEKARLFLEMGNGALLEKDPISALQYLDLALKEDASIPEIFHSQALAFYQKKEFSSAILSAKKAIQLHPSYSEAKLTLGKLLADTGSSSEAIVYLEQAGQDVLNREAYKAWTNLGILYYHKKQLKKAETSLAKAIQEAPQQACVAYYYLGHIQFQGGSLKQAVHHYEKATQNLCTHLMEAYLSLGEAYQKDHQYDLARKTFVEIQKKYPKTEFAYKALEYLKHLP